AGCDLGEDAIRCWVRQHWCGYLRARWVEHLQGTRFWLELDRGDFGLLKREFHDHAVLLDRIVDRIKSGQENLHIIQWAIEWKIHIAPVPQIPHPPHTHPPPPRQSFRLKLTLFTPPSRRCPVVFDR